MHRLALVCLSVSLGCAPKAASSDTPAEPSPHEHAHEGQHAHGDKHAHEGQHAHGDKHAEQGHGHHRFDDAEAWAKHFDSPERDAWQKPDSVLAFMGLAPDTTVADLGAGTGYFAMRFAAAVPKGSVFANDIEPDMVRYLTERAEKDGLSNVTAVQGTAAAPALPQPVDVAFMCNVYHHIEDRPAYFAKVREQLREGGRLVIVDFRKDAAEDVPGPPPAMRVSQEQLVAEMQAAGWTLARSDRDALTHQYIVELVPATAP